jgi:hypothetical protein
MGTLLEKLKVCELSYEVFRFLSCGVLTPGRYVPIFREAYSLCLQGRGASFTLETDVAGFSRNWISIPMAVM